MKNLSKIFLLLIIISYINGNSDSKYETNNNEEKLINDKVITYYAKLIANHILETSFQISDKCGHFKSYSGWYSIDPEKINNIGWVHIYKICKYDNYTYPAISPNIYARDFTGDVYFKNIKFESSSTSTPWLPNSTDNIYISSTVPFTENNNNNKLYIGQNWIDANQFY